MAERIWIRGQKGALEGVQEEAFGDEYHLQELIAEHPELIDGEQIRPDDARRWILIAREKGIAETSDTGARWSLDHLIIDQDAEKGIEMGTVTISYSREYFSTGSYLMRATDLNLQCD